MACLDELPYAGGPDGKPSSGVERAAEVGRLGAQVRGGPPRWTERSTSSTADGACALFLAAPVNMLSTPISKSLVIASC